jgi:ribose 5-phosphate isomerase B
MRVVLGCDHGGLTLKGVLHSELSERGYTVEDCGTYGHDSVDYPDYAKVVVEKVVSGAADRGILICGTGQGMAMTANKMPGVRAAVVSDVFSAKMAMQHNDARVLCLGERIIGPSLALEITSAWLEANFEGGRHQRRVDKISG